MDIVYVLGLGSKYKDAELDFSVKLVRKYAKGFDRIFVFGDAPRKKIEDIIHVPCSDISDISDINIFQKLLHVCGTRDVSDRFIFMNDDHYLIDYKDLSNIPNYALHLPIDKKAATTGGAYGSRVRKTSEFLKKHNKSLHFFDVHTPIIYDKSKFMEIKPLFDFTTGMVIKSLYGNWHGLEPVLVNDGKSRNPAASIESGFISSNPTVFPAFFRYLEDHIKF